ncbi:MAG: PCMD domain-containing protein [Rikenellaceae bacterium]|nr:PCMD domain-containing protein [Rikenellaceae bacterium]
MRRINIIIMTLLLATGCIPNDIPYPNRQPSFKAFEVEGQVGSSEFDQLNRKVSLTVDGEHDITNVRVIFWDISDSTEMLPAMPDRLNLAKPYLCTLRTWQDYQWTIDAKWDVQYLVNVEDQIGDASVDTVGRVMIVTVAKTQHLASMKINKIQIGPTNAVITPDPLEGTFDLRGDGQVFKVNMFGRTEEWRISAAHAQFSIQSKSVTAWTKTATATASVPVGATDIGYEYRREVDEAWNQTDIENITLDGGTMTAVITGLEPGTKYVCRPFLGDERGQEQTFTTDKVEEIPNMNFEQWHQADPKGICWYPYAQGGTPYWITGNYATAQFGSTNATIPVEDGANDSKYGACLETKKVAGQLAAGNLFTGDFKFTSITEAANSPKFGRPFTGRPAGLKGWYKYQPQAISDAKNDDDKKLIGQPDQCHIYISLENWRGATERPKEDARDVVAYGEFKTSESSDSYKEFVINIDYKSTTIKPTHIVLVTTSSVYGDRYCGGKGSKLWVDELSFDYDSTPIVR